MQEKQKDKEKGFTLIELLVVIAIVAVLATAVISSSNTARAKGRDAKRISEMKSLQKALDLYFDTCGGYPKIAAPGPAYADIGAAGGLLTSTQDGTCAASATTFGTYMSVLPANPSPGGATYKYCSTDEGAAIGAGSCNNTKGASYQITFALEGDTGSLSFGTHTATPSGIL